MTLFLRTKNNETILDVEYWVANTDDYEHLEISSTIDIRNYSLFLLSKKDDYLRGQIITDFDELSELRGWLWEVYFMTEKNTPKHYDNVLEELKNILNKVADKYNLMFIQD